MWDFIAVIMSASVFFILINEVKKTNCRYISFLGIIILLRFMLSAFHEITFLPLFAGLSINALFSILTVGVAFIVIPLYLWKLKVIIPIYGFLVCILLSAFINGEIAAGISTLIKWLYLCVIALLTYHVMKQHCVQKVLKVLIIPFFLPVTLQVISLLLGHSKDTEGEGAISYIGGYNHEAVFSVMIFTYMMLLSFREKQTISYQPLLMVFAFVSLYWVNYRTAMLAAMPVFLSFYWDYAVSLVRPSQRIVIRLGVFLLATFTIMSVFPIVSGRFSDIGVVLEGFSELFRSDLYYTRDEQRLFSGRIYFWSQYLTQYYDAPSTQLLFGFGPDAWKHSFDKYAHNTYVSFIYEFGIVGLFAFLYLLLAPLIAMIKTPNNSVRTKLIVSYAGFVILNIATMPLWQVEGIILYGILLGFSWFYLLENQERLNTTIPAIKSDIRSYTL